MVSDVEPDGGRRVHVKTWLRLRENADVGVHSETANVNVEGKVASVLASLQPDAGGTPPGPATTVGGEWATASGGSEPGSRATRVAHG